MLNATKLPLKYLIPTETPNIYQLLKTDRLGKMAEMRLLDEIERSDDKDSENKNVNDLLADESNSYDILHSQSNASESLNNEPALNFQRPSEYEQIEAEEGSGDESNLEPITKSSTSSGFEVTKSSVLENPSTKSLSILTSDILNYIAEATTEGPTFEETVSNFTEQSSDSIPPSIMDETAESLIASSDNKNTVILDDGNTHQMKSSVIIVVSCVTGVVLLAIIGLAYIVSFQRHTGTLDIEMQEQRCGKDNQEDNQLKDETHERLLAPQETSNFITVGDTL